MITIKQWPKSSIWTKVVLRDDQNAGDGEKIAKELMDSLGVNLSNLITGAYMDLIQNK